MTTFEHQIQVISMSMHLEGGGILLCTETVKCYGRIIIYGVDALICPKLHNYYTGNATFSIQLPCLNFTVYTTLVCRSYMLPCRLCWLKQLLLRHITHVMKQVYSPNRVPPPPFPITNKKIVDRWWIPCSPSDSSRLMTFTPCIIVSRGTGMPLLLCTSW